MWLSFVIAFQYQMSSTETNVGTLLILTRLIALEPDNFDLLWHFLGPVNRNKTLVLLIKVAGCNFVRFKCRRENFLVLHTMSKFLACCLFS